MASNTRIYKEPFTNNYGFRPALSYKKKRQPRYMEHVYFVGWLALGIVGYIALAAF